MSLLDLSLAPLRHFLLELDIKLTNAQARGADRVGMRTCHFGQGVTGPMVNLIFYQHSFILDFTQPPISKAIFKQHRSERFSLFDAVQARCLWKDLTEGP